MKEQQESIQQLQAELGTGLMSQLSAAEQADLAAINPRLKQLEVAAPRVVAPLSKLSPLFR